MTERVRDRLCWLGALLVLLVGVVVWMLGQPSTGLGIHTDGSGRAVVTDVATGSVAWAAGVQPGETVVTTGSSAATVSDPDGRTVEITPFAAAYSLLLPALWGSVVLLVACWLIGRRLAGQRFVARFVAPFALAATTPLSLVPAAAFGSPGTLAVSALLWPLCVVPLATVVMHEAPSGPTADRVRAAVGAAIVGALGLIPMLYVVAAPAAWVIVLRETLVGLALFGPVLVLLASTRSRQDNEWTLPLQPLVGMLVITALAGTPLVIHLALAAPSVSVTVVVLSAWLLAGAFVARYVVRPLVRLATGALQQRDLVAAAADAERRRIAADLHDGPLQSLTMLAYRLDAAGDIENAALARDVMTELRAVTSSLRLPVVDDLGAGPALEWLTTQVGRLSGLEIELERMDTGRPPLDVEHAVFRVAQEALANATRHGHPPIRVRYEAGSSRVRLIVNDAGQGLGGEQPRFDDEHGLGIVGMQERAHSIGAALEIGPSAAGSRVALVWPAVAS